MDGRTPAFHEERRHLEPIIDGTVLGPDNATELGDGESICGRDGGQERHECERSR